jgi:5S rRNA maturation endonuclease (ribonuclease M5)
MKKCRNKFDRQRLADELYSLLDDLKSCNKTKPIVVEGKSDEKALRQLGIKGMIFRLDSGNTLFGVCENISKNHKEVIVLTDWDSKGRELCVSLKNAFTANCVKCDFEYRRKIAYLCRKEIKDVESLFRYMKKLSEYEISGSY